MIIEYPILESIKDLQEQHGLKYENYRRYRSYCSRRLHRLRKSLNKHQGIAGSAKARHQRARKLMNVNNSMVLEAGEQEYAERMLVIPLCLAERAWAYAMQLKQETSDHPRRQFHLERRLKKASEHAQRFEELCHDAESPCSENTKLEATAYAAYVTGNYQVERNLLQEGKETLNKALSIYFKLAIWKDGYRQRIDEIRNSIRYCTFCLGNQDSKKPVKVELPSKLQFHDLAFKHVIQLKDEESEDKAEQEVEVKQETKVAKQDVDEDDEDDEAKFEEAKGAADGEEEEEEDEETDDDDDAGASNQGTSGVTGLVKNWLGRAWS